MVSRSRAHTPQDASPPTAHKLLLTTLLQRHANSISQYTLSYCRGNEPMMCGQGWCGPYAQPNRQGHITHVHSMLAGKHLPRDGRGWTSTLTPLLHYHYTLGCPYTLAGLADRAAACTRACTQHLRWLRRDAPPLCRLLLGDDNGVRRRAGARRRRGARERARGARMRAMYMYHFGNNSRRSRNTVVWCLHADAHGSS